MDKQKYIDLRLKGLDQEIFRAYMQELPTKEVFSLMNFPWKVVKQKAIDYYDEKFNCMYLIIRTNSKEEIIEII